MNVRTTILLAILVVLAVAGWVAFIFLQPAERESETLAFLKSLDPKKIERIEISRAGKTEVVLARAGGAWQMPGNWPIRDMEVEELVKNLTSLGTRYAPIPVRAPNQEDKFSGYGIDKDALKVALKVDGKTHTLTLGEPPDEKQNRFSRPTYLRLDDKAEVVRLGPNLIAQLDRPKDYYQKRQLFPSERVAKNDKGREKVDQLLAKEIRAAGPEDTVITVVKEGDAWELRSPRDRADAEKIKTILTKAPDIWAEQFVDINRIRWRHEGWPLPLTGLAPTLNKRDFYTSQAVWAATLALTSGSDAGRLGLVSFGPLAQSSFLAAEALPTYLFKATRPDGVALTLYVGGVSSETTRKTMKTINIPGKGPITVPEDVTEQRRYARVEDPSGERSLKDMPLFEVKADLLKDMPLTLEALREARLVKFDADDARRLEIEEHRAGEKKAGYETVLAFEKVKEKKMAPKEEKKDDPFKKDDDDPFKKDEPKEVDVWRMRQPSEQTVEREPLQDLLREISRLESRDDAAYPGEAELARFGLDQPKYRIKLTYEEESKDKKKDKKAKDEKKITREIVLLVGGPAKTDSAKADDFGKTDKGKKDEPSDAKKLYVQVAGWPRVSAVDEKLLQLVSRPAYAYRSRQVLDLAGAAIEKLEVQHGKNSFVLAREKDAWKLESPVKAEAAEKKVDPLLDELRKLQAVEFVADKPGKEDLEKKYGLAPAQTTVKLHLKDAKDKKTEHVLHLGKQRPDRPDFYARLDDGPVFVLKKEVAEDLQRDSLAYRSSTIWRLAPHDIVEIEVQGKEKPYRLVKEEKGWKVTGPIDAPAAAEAASFATRLAKINAARFIDHAAADVAKYGLKEPAVKLTLKLADKKEKEKTLLIGNTVEKESGERYAKVEGEEGVFVLDAPTLSRTERTAYDWLDRVLLTVNPAQIQSIQASGKSEFVLQKKSGEWEVSKSPAPTFTAEDANVQTFLKSWRSLEAERVAATGSKIDWTKFGLDKPHLTLTIKQDLPEGKPIEHTLTLGAEAGKGERFARMDKSDFVAVLSPATVQALEKSHVDFLPLGVLKYTIADLTGLSRTGAGDVSIVKRGDAWQLDKPYDRPADEVVVNDLMDRTFRLRASRIAAFPAKDLAPFGLDKPLATWKLHLTDPTGAPSDETILIGGPAGKDGEHFAMKAKDDKVFVLPADLSRTLLGQPLSFADRNINTFARADQAIQERDKRRVVFTKVGGDWKVTGPVEAKAEDAELENFVKEISRLRAELVEQKPADLKKFGLEKGEIVWTFRLGDKDVLKLHVGAAEDTKEKEPRRYARIEGNDTVFLLPAKATQQALGEYRERKALAGFDAVAAEELRYKSPAGVYRLRKREDTWTLLEEADKKVNSKAVTETLDALAGLKVVRYLTDTKDAEQETLAGLQNPEWTIDVRSEKQTFALAIGRPAAGGKGRYARSAEAIFILSDADLERILRPAAAFLASPEPKTEDKAK